MSANFNWFINRQGPKGNQGPKGDTGFSPSIEVNTNTAAEYRLKIINEDNEIITDNLRGSAVDDMGGTYMRYDPETQKMFAGTADPASDISYGVVRIAGEADIENMDSVGVVSAGQVADALHVYLKSTDGSVVITQDDEDFKTNLSVDFSGVEGDISGLDSRVTGCESAINTLENTTIPAIEGDISDNAAAILQNAGDITDLQNNKANSADLARVAFSGDYDDLIDKPNLATVATSGDYDDLTNKPTIPAAQIQSDWNQSDSAALDFIKNKPTIPSVSNMMTVDTAQSVSGAKTFGSDTLKVGDGNTSQVVANYDSTLYPLVLDDTISRAGGTVLGDSSNNHITSLERGTMMKVYDSVADTTKLAHIFTEFNLVGGTNAAIIQNTTTGAYEIVAHDTVYTPSNGIDISNANAISVKVDGTTIDYDSSGNLTVVGGGIAPSNMATTDTAQSITGVKTFSTNAIKINNLLLSDGSKVIDDKGSYVYVGSDNVTTKILSNNTKLYFHGSSGTDEEMAKVSQLPSVMVAASSVANGYQGLVPTPIAGDNDKFLSGDGTFKAVAQINDTTASANSVYSSSKIENIIGNINSVLDAINGEVI